MELHYNVFAILVSASIVFALSVTGSFICWVNTAFDYAEKNESQSQRWKWMVILFFILLTAFLLGKPT